jgi:hypothetical protein
MKGRLETISGVSLECALQPTVFEARREGGLGRFGVTVLSPTTFAFPVFWDDTSFQSSSFSLGEGIEDIFRREDIWEWTVLTNGYRMGKTF